jgi:hypothetical protein
VDAVQYDRRIVRLAFERLGEWRLPPTERQAARAERRAERAMRLERDSEYAAERRAAALDAEARRFASYRGHGLGAGGGNIGGLG